LKTQRNKKLDRKKIIDNSRKVDCSDKFKFINSKPMCLGASYVKI